MSVPGDPVHGPLDHLRYPVRRSVDPVGQHRGGVTACRVHLRLREEQRGGQIRSVEPGVPQIDPELVDAGQVHAAQVRPDRGGTPQVGAGHRPAPQITTGEVGPRSQQSGP